MERIYLIYVECIDKSSNNAKRFNARFVSVNDEKQLEAVKSCYEIVKQFKKINSYKQGDDYIYNVVAQEYVFTKAEDIINDVDEFYDEFVNVI